MALVESTAKRSDLRLRPEVTARLKAFGEGIGEKTSTKAVERLLDSVGVASVSNSEEMPILTLDNAMLKIGPIEVVGRSGLGKSFSLRALLFEAYYRRGIPVILVDVADEHAELVKRRTVRALRNYSRKQIYRFVPEREPDRREFTLGLFFSDLLALANKHKLTEFIVAIDEGSELINIKALRDFLIESRKFLRKVIIVSADEDLYSKICVPMRPLPFERKRVEI